MKTLFITGASGFIGRHLLAKLNHKTFDMIYCLSRTGELPSLDLFAHPNIRVIKGDLFDADAYADSLALSDIVLHLAAVTGKATPEEYFAVNAAGTESLVNQCERLAVKNFLYVSTIAVKYPDISRYYYAQSKKAGEDAVKRSSLSFSIARPTIVIGNDGPIWLNLAKLAKAPFPFIFGDGKTKIQPIYVDDLAKCLLFVLNNGLFSNETYELGGPAIITFENFIKLLRLKYREKESSLIHVPAHHLLQVLDPLERYFHSFLPINTGQLSPFIYDSNIKSNSLHKRFASSMSSPEEMISIVFNREKRGTFVRTLNKECGVFCRYLLNVQPNEYVLRKYYAGHMAGNAGFQTHESAFDRFSIKFSKFGRYATRLVDSYTRIFSRRSVFRNKLVLLLAILESTSPYNKRLDRVYSSRKATFYLSLLTNCLIFGFTFLLSLVVLGPIHLLSGISLKFRPSH
jgi:NADH dehydrogenase